MPLNTKDAGLSEVAALAVLVEILIAQLIANGTTIALTQAQLTTAHNAADARTALATHGSRRFARQTS